MPSNALATDPALVGLMSGAHKRQMADGDAKRIFITIRVVVKRERIGICQGAESRR
jgi:hypothetical protein